jgi:hypothetical protein
VSGILQEYQTTAKEKQADTRKEENPAACEKASQTLQQTLVHH